MSFCLSDNLLVRQRSRAWTPLLSQQLRLRHIHQISGFNLPELNKGESYYFTLHLTTLSAPFYTSDKIESVNPKWAELDQRNLQNLSANAIVLRIWRYCPENYDIIITTWGINLGGLVYLGNKIAEIQANFFLPNTVIFNMRYGYFTSHRVINFSGVRPPPFIDNLNLIKDNENEQKVFRQTTTRILCSELRNSYDIEKLRRLQYLQVAIKNKSLDVQNIREKIGIKCGSEQNIDNQNNLDHDISSTSPTNVRYAPQLLTMNSLNKLLEVKPTKMQRKEMVKIRNEIEIAQFRSKLLSQEHLKKSTAIRKYKHELKDLVESNEEKSSELMERYYELNKNIERLKELKKTIGHNLDMILTLHSQLFRRRKQLMQQLLFIYPIQKISDSKYTINGIYLPNADMLSDCSDQGISVALGYTTHILLMCSTFLQVPLRYPLTHYGSRSCVTDFISHVLPERERDFPLFTKGKEKIQFTYAVYLLNKNIAQLRWLLYIHTPQLKATLPNLLGLIEGTEAKEVPPIILTNLTSKLDRMDQVKPDLEYPIKSQNAMKKYNQMLPSCECGPGLSEILAIPEAFMNKQITAESFKNFSALKRETENVAAIKERTGEEEKCCCDDSDVPIEQGTDLLDPTVNLVDLSQQLSLSDCQEDGDVNLGCNGRQSQQLQQQQEEQQDHQEQEEEKQQSDVGNHNSCEDAACSGDSSSNNISTNKSSQVPEGQLTSRTNALLTTKSFILVKSKTNM